MTTTAPIEITWKPNFADAKLGLALALWGNLSKLTRTVILLFIFPSAVIIWILMHSTVLPMTTLSATVVGILAGSLFGALFLSIFGAFFVRKLVKIQLARSDAQIITISDEGVERRSPKTNMCHPWSAILRVAELPQAFILFSDSAAIGSIEKSSITSEDEIRKLRAFINSKKPIQQVNSTFLALSRANT